MHFTQTENTELLCQHYLKLIYDEIQANVQFRSPGDYAEILFEGVTKLLTKVKVNDNDRFVDFGSGKGKIAAQVFLQTPVKESAGIELVEGLHHQATLAADRIAQDLPQFFSHGRKLAFFHGNFLNYPLSDMTITLINSICFSQELINSLGTLLNEIRNIHTIVTLRPIATLTQFTFKRSTRIECSWDSALCYIYERNN